MGLNVIYLDIYWELGDKIISFCNRPRLDAYTKNEFLAHYKQM